MHNLTTASLDCVRTIREHIASATHETRAALADALAAFDAADSDDVRRKLAATFGPASMPSYRDRPAASFHHLSAAVARRLHGGHDVLLAGRGVRLLREMDPAGDAALTHELNLERELRAMLDLCDTLTPHVEREAAIVEGGPAKPTTASADDGLSGEAKALALLVQHPDWTDTQIADGAGVPRTSLYRWDQYKAARKALKAGREDAAPSGRRDARTGRIEAESDE